MYVISVYIIIIVTTIYIYICKTCNICIISNIESLYIMYNKKYITHIYEDLTYVPGIINRLFKCI